MKRLVLLSLPMIPLKLTIAYHHGEDGITARIVEIPGVISEGDTLEEARENVMDALQTMLDYQRKLAAKNQPGDVITEELAIA